MDTRRKWIRQHLSLAANQVYQYNMASKANSLLVRNYSLTNQVFMDLTPDLTATRYEQAAALDGWGVIARPHELDSVFLLSTANLDITVTEVLSPDPIPIIQSALQRAFTSAGVTITTALPAGANTIGGVTLPDLNSWLTAEVIRGAAGATTVKATPGQVAGIVVLTDGVTVTLQDNVTNRWVATGPAAVGDPVIPALMPWPIACANNIQLNFSGAGTAYIIYK